MLTGRCYSVEMDKHKIPADAKAELERHVWGTFVDGKADFVRDVRNAYLMSDLSAEAWQKKNSRY